MSNLSSAVSDKSLFSTSAVGLKTNLEGARVSPQFGESIARKEVRSKSRKSHIFPTPS